MKTTAALHVEEQWPYVLTLLPPNLDASAKETSALVRCRNVPDAAALIRLALAYAVSDLSLKDVAAWAAGLGVAEITGPGLFYRLREAEKWLTEVLAQTLQDQIKPAPKGWNLCAVDATVITGPGAEGTEWRAHVRLDPSRGTFRSVELTDEHGGEGYGRHPIQAGEVVLGDRAYATARGIHAVSQAQGFVVARLNPHTLRVCGKDRQVLSLRRRARRIPRVGAMEFDIEIPIPPTRAKNTHKPWLLKKAIAWVSARAVAGRTRTGEVIWIVTTLQASQASALQILQLYRVRWQIELLFKRLKSLLHLDALPSRQGPTAKSWMLARLLAAALAQKMVTPAGPLSPWGYELEATWLHS
jgi:hypothetical protein